MPDYTVGDTVYKRFTTRAFATGIPGTLGGSPVVSAYEDDSITQITAGITLGVDHDSVTGLNLLTIVATGGNGFEAGKSYDFVITTGTVDSVSVVGEVVWHFTLSAEAAAVDLANATDGLGAIKAETALIVGDTNELQVDDYPTTIAALQTDLDTLTAGVNVTQFAGGAIPAPAVTGVPDVNVTHVGDTAQTPGDLQNLITTVDTVVDGIQTDLSNATDGLGAIKAETALIVADTNELQGDWTNTGRLDTIIDQILADTGTDGVAIAVGAIAANRFAAGAIDAAALAADAGTEIAAAVWATVIETEGTITAKQAMQINICTLAGATSADGLEFLTPNSVVTRITIGAINATNNRSAVVLNFA